MHTLEVVKEKLWEEFDELDEETVMTVLDAVADVLGLPRQGRLIFCRGDMKNEFKVGAKELTATVIVENNDEDLRNLNHMKDGMVTVLGLEQPEQMEIDMEAAAAGSEANGEGAE